MVGTSGYVYLGSIVILIGQSLVTQPMMQRRPNQTELRLMDYIQILCRFQKI
jgi:hypothetical protein